MNQRLVKLLDIIMLLFLLGAAYAHSELRSIKTTEAINTRISNAVRDTIFSFVEKMPEFPGGKDSLMRFIAFNCKIPTEVIKNGIYGRVTLQFVVNKEGQVESPKVLKGIDAGCDEEAIRMIRNLPVWTPGRQNGKAVAVYMIVPILFQRAKEQPLANKMPEFPGGQDSLYRFLEINMKYPNDAEENGISGTVEVMFNVTKSGKIINPRITKGLFPSLNAEALRLVSLFPDWIPAYKDKEPIDADHSFEFVFQVDNKKDKVEEQAQFPGGVDELVRYLSKNIKYPVTAQKFLISGEVILTFVIDEIGQVSNIKVIRSLGGGCDEEAIRVVETMPKWKPGKLYGRPVKVAFTLPIIFHIPLN